MIDIPLRKTDSAYTKFMKGSNVYDLFKYNTTPVKLPISQDWLDKNKIGIVYFNIFFTSEQIWQQHLPFCYY